MRIPMCVESDVRTIQAHINEWCVCAAATLCCRRYLQELAEREVVRAAASGNMWYCASHPEHVRPMLQVIRQDLNLMVGRGDGTAAAYAATMLSFPRLRILSPHGGTLQT
jgi:hypothetical protein